MLKDLHSFHSFSKVHILAKIVLLLALCVTQLLNILMKGAASNPVASSVVSPPSLFRCRVVGCKVSVLILIKNTSEREKDFLPLGLPLTLREIMKIRCQFSRSLCGYEQVAK